MVWDQVPPTETIYVLSMCYVFLLNSVYWTLTVLLPVQTDKPRTIEYIAVYVFKI